MPLQIVIATAESDATNRSFASVVPDQPCEIVYENAVAAQHAPATATIPLLESTSAASKIARP